MKGVNRVPRVHRVPKVPGVVEFCRFYKNGEIHCLWKYAIAVSIFLIVGAGCGKKAMPTPPNTAPVPAVSDLSYRIDGSDVNLAWTVPAGAGEGEAVVSRARTKLSDGECNECPLIFQRIAELPVSATQDAVKQTYREPLAQGFRYTYRVVLRKSGGRTSAPSNLVTFDY